LGKPDVKIRIEELTRISKSKLEIYNLLENEVSQDQKEWLASKIFSTPSPELVKEYKPYNHFLALVLIIQCYFAVLIFIGSGPESLAYKYISSFTTIIIYLILILGIFGNRLNAYNSLIILCVLNIFVSSFNMVGPLWKELLLSDLINISQILYISWLRKKIFPEMNDPSYSINNNRKQIFIRNR
jgi:hypothetical protein